MKLARSSRFFEAAVFSAYRGWALPFLSFFSLIIAPYPPMEHMGSKRRSTLVRLLRRRVPVSSFFAARVPFGMRMLCQSLMLPSFFGLITADDFFVLPHVPEESLGMRKDWATTVDGIRRTCVGLAFSDFFDAPEEQQETSRWEPGERPRTAQPSLTQQGCFRATRGSGLEFLVGRSVALALAELFSEAAEFPADSSFYRAVN